MKTKKKKTAKRIKPLSQRYPAIYGHGNATARAEEQLAVSIAELGYIYGEQGFSLSRLRQVVKAVMNKRVK